MSVTLLFTDGVGIGLPAPRNNPLAGGRYLLSQFADGTGEPLPDPGRVYPLDTTFGVNGRPQSASNQTALFTGLPAPALLGRHVLGYPNAELRQLLERHSVVKALTSRGRRVAFANGYPAAYLDALGLKRTPSAGGELAIPPAQARRLRPSASTLAMAAGAVTLRTWEDVRSGRALTHDVDGQHARAKGLPLPHRSAEEAADIFWAVAREEDFTLFEHYLADEAAHRQDAEGVQSALATFDAFARAVISRRRPDDHVLVCSDHGNAEEQDHRRHTRRPVALLHFGPAPLAPPTDLAGVGKAILRLLDVPEGPT